MSSERPEGVRELAGVRVVVAGLGPMGRGIARVFDRAGAQVQVVDISAEAGERGLALIRDEAESDDEQVAATAGADLESALADADVFIEAVVEDMAVKRDLLEAVAKFGRPDLLVVSNTSSLSVSEMGRAFGDPARVVGMHFFNPATKMRLVEVIVGAATSEASVARALELTQALGKSAVTCKDSPNFVVNRVCRPLYYEAQLLVTQGVEVAVVDAVARGALGHRMGPLQLLDFAGLHTHLASSETALREFGDPRYRPIPQARALVRAGMTGRAAGRGFYDYGREKPRDAQARVVREPEPSNGVRVAFAGPDAARLADHEAIASVTDDAAPVVVYSCRRTPTEMDAEKVRQLASRRAVVVDSSDGRWLDILPHGAAWVRIHRTPADGLFVEVVDDRVAGITVTDAVATVLDALGAPSVRVLALPGLVADRLVQCMINEATGVVEEGTADPKDVDVALRLAMNHPFGPFEYLARCGAANVYAGLRSMTDLIGDPRYRPAQLLRRQAAAEERH